MSQTDFISAETHNLHSGQVEATLAGEVGLLTRNIVIEGNKYPGFENKLRGRVIVSRLTQDGLDYEGSAKLDAVEFRNMGQLGFDDTDDPRFSLAFHSLGETTSNYVKRCSFNVNFSPALGFFSTNSVPVEANIFYHSVGSGSDNVYKDNLLVSMLFPGTYNGAQETQNMDWYGAFNLNKATNPVLENNVVAGSEQAGIRTYGENCQDASLWINNEIHSAIFGVLLRNRVVLPACVWVMASTAGVASSFASVSVSPTSPGQLAFIPLGRGGRDTVSTWLWGGSLSDGSISDASPACYITPPPLQLKKEHNVTKK
ncbi:hypothetical protein Pmani_002105 [Petrolisthes manimaculis]|uniref:CEMIP beta-helix domain-containing protein n=1 Tax=Petrolisthes manimaculis TaxID=1843537 RepID=A0AAE1UNS8_9EUCA|nr:hypothetical protein Pmani_002105 [Petrolisthes manimaculis]